MSQIDSQEECELASHWRSQGRLFKDSFWKDLKTSNSLWGEKNTDICMRTVGSRRHVYQFPLLRFILSTKYEDQVAALLRTLYSSLSLRLSGLLPVYALRRAGRSPGAGGLDLYL